VEEERRVATDLLNRVVHDFRRIHTCSKQRECVTVSCTREENEAVSCRLFVDHEGCAHINNDERENATVCVVQWWVDGCGCVRAGAYACVRG
jgi:hypothetical protein